MQKGKINVTTENIFPIIKKFLYSDHEIFLRELVTNAIDASQKLKKIVSKGEASIDLGDLTIRIDVDEEKKTITVSDKGVGMTADEIGKYINEIAFSSAEEFVNKFKDKTGIIGKFGLGFYSSFMVSEKVEIISKSYKDDTKAVKWSCDGSPNYTVEEVEKEERGTDIILYIDEESKEFAKKARINELLDKYCKFLPIEIAFGKETEYKDEKQVETDKDKIINDTNPIWTKTPADLKDEDYKNFYNKLYPLSDESLFHIHLNVDYPFNLTGILYFPKIKNNVEVQKNKIQLYSNQVFVTNSVEGIVPEFLTLLHGVIDSPDIPLNVSRSYLQSDTSVKKIASHITKKVADKLKELFLNDRDEFEKKWDDLKVFIVYGMLTEEKFYEKGQKFSLFKNVDNKYFTFEEYENIIKDNQTDKNKNLVYLYSTDVEKQYTFIENAKNKGYDVLSMEGQLDTHFINQLEQKFENTKFVRVDADVAEKLIEKENTEESNISSDEKSQLTSIFESQLPQKNTFTVSFESMNKDGEPLVVTQSEFMRRMKDMAAMGGGGGMNFYGQMPDSYNVVVNTNHELINKIIEDKTKKLGNEISKFIEEKNPLLEEKAKLEKAKEGKKDEEIEVAEKEKLKDVEKKINEIESKEKGQLIAFGNDNKLVKQLVDLALLANNMLSGEELTKFVKRSIELIK
ncbi:MAG: molecular chaperone HtpG [Bacteroidales bacterium]|jgi:molecular chaperone HtpG|nr:molecular chaperone HtpG [Bacteroidales bacterium]